MQIGVLEIHTWGARIDKIEMPDRLIFDLDPAPDLPWERTVASAHQIREFLDELGLVGFVKTTGGKGLHLGVPSLRRRHEGHTSGEFCQQLAESIVRAAPKQYTSNMSRLPGREKSLSIICATLVVLRRWQPIPRGSTRSHGFDAARLGRTYSRA